MDTIRAHNDAINEALEAIDQRIERLDLDGESNLVAGLEVAYAMLRGLLR
jgi:Mg-chelatase subunit ChlD